MDNKQLEHKVFNIMENIKKVAIKEYGMYLKNGKLIVDPALLKPYPGKMVVDCEDLMGKILIGLDELYGDSIVLIGLDE